MGRSVALIRGVGGKTAMKMTELTAAVEAVGLCNVVTLQVAGNVVFDDDGQTAVQWGDLVHRAVLTTFGFDLPVIVRSHAELVDLETRNPFVGTHDGKWVMTTALDRTPEANAVAALNPDQFSPDQYVVDGAEIFARYDGGVGTSKMQPAWFEKRLGVVGTARNANTIGKLIAMTAPGGS